MVSESRTLLSAVEATGAGTVVIDAEDNLQDFVFYVKRTGTVDCTVAIQARQPTGDWIAIHSQAYTTVDTEVIQVTRGAFDQLRANVTTWVSGVVTVTVDAS